MCGMEPERSLGYTDYGHTKPSACLQEHSNHRRALVQTTGHYVITPLDVLIHTCRTLKSFALSGNHLVLSKMAGCENHELKLLGTWMSPFVIRVRLALSLKGLSYEYIEQNIRDKSELLVVSNPVHKKVPVLIHDGKPICESEIIVQYIDEAFPGAGAGFLPSDPYERAVARFWVSYIDDK
ncbi:hypothetical protein E2562_027069, partial [Oryza meyeriana var. granulata]